MNVLVYTSSASHGLAHALRSVLSPFYTVQFITSASLATQPWAASCALLVLSPPDTSPTPLSFPRPAYEAIQEYIIAGGCVLGFGLGVSLLPHRPTRDRFNFWDAKSGTAVVPESPQDSEGSAHSTSSSILLQTGGLLSGLRSAGVSFELTRAALDNEVIRGHWREPSGAIAGIQMPVGSGCAAFWGVSPHLEGIEDRESVLALLRYSLASLGLSVPSEMTPDESPDPLPAIPRHPLPQFLLHPPGKRYIVETILQRLGLASASAAQSANDSEIGLVKDRTDTFHFYRVTTLEHGERLVAEARASTDASSGAAMETDAPRVVIILSPDALPTKELTPRFDAEKYFTMLAEVREGQASNADSWGLGEALFYGEAVTSTQTMLERYAPAPSVTPARRSN